MEFVQKYIQDRLDSEGLSFNVQLVEHACVYSMHSGQEMVILQSDVGLCARATLCKCFAEKLIMTHHPEHGPLLQIKDTFVTVDWTQSLADQHVSISADLLDEKNGDSEEFIGVLVLQVLLDRSQGEAEVLIARTTSQKKDLEHGQSEVVVILASSCQLICILAKVSCQLFKVLSRVLTWVPGLDDSLEIFKPLNGGGLD